MDLPDFFERILDVSSVEVTTGPLLAEGCFVDVPQIEGRWVSIDDRDEGRLEVYYEQSRSFNDDEFWNPEACYDAMNEAYDEFRAKYEAAVKELTERWGEPIPTEEADPLAKRCHKGDGGFGFSAWRHGKVVAFVAVEHNDKEWPVGLVVGVMPAE